MVNETSSRRPGSDRGRGGYLPAGRRPRPHAVRDACTLVAALAAALMAVAPAARGLPWPAPRPLATAHGRGAAPASAAAAADSALARADRALIRGEPDLALRLYAEVPPAAGAAARARHGEARCWLALGRGERAVEALREAVALADSSATGRETAASALELLGQTFLRLGRPDRARAVFRDLARRWPERRDWAAVMIGRTWQGESAYRSALDAIRPQLREGRYAPAYDLAVALYWRLDGGERRELDRLLRGYLRAAGRDFTGGAGR